MDQNQQSMTNPEQESPFSIISVPEHLRDQVLAHIAELTEGDAEVSGYMIGLSTHSLGSSTIRNLSGSGCTQWSTGAQMDFNCTDND